jgi:RNA polymerase sigma-70 factor (ECF subfamily)
LLSKDGELYWQSYKLFVISDNNASHSSQINKNHTASMIYFTYRFNQKDKLHKLTHLSIMGPTTSCHITDLGFKEHPRQISICLGFERKPLLSADIIVNIANGKLIDEQLVTLSQLGDAQAFGLLVEKYQNRLYRVILRIIKNQSVVEELVQESFIKAYRSIANFRGDSAFYTWLYKIGLNTARNYLFDKKPRTEIDRSIELEDLDNLTTASDLYRSETSESELRNKQIAKTVNDSIDALPSDLKLAITLREIDGLTYEQISLTMDCPIGTTISRIFRARNIISEKLKPLLNNKQDKVGNLSIAFRE